MTEEPHTVLIVDDEPEIVDVYAHPLSKRYAVRTANDGEEALDELDDEVDVVVLDRRMPGMSGEQLLKIIRERNFDVRVVIVTAVEPDFDIVDMGFDSYLSKPVTDSDLLEAVDELITVSRYDKQVRDLFAVVKKRTALQSAKTSEQLAESEEYRKLTERRDELMEVAGESIASMPHETLRKVFENLATERGWLDTES